MKVDELQIDVPHIISNEKVHVTSQRFADGTGAVVYRRPGTSDVVLDLKVDSSGNVDMRAVDRGFWTITIDGKVSTDSELSEVLSRHNGGCSIQVNSQTLDIRSVPNTTSGSPQFV